MKRNKPLKRTQLAPKARVYQHRAKVRGARLAEKRAAWHDYVVRIPCAMCAAFPPTAEERGKFGFLIAKRRAHHILEQQDLKAHARRIGIDAQELLLWDTANGICLCEWHHGRHHQHIQRVPRALLPEPVHDFAAKWKLDWLLDRDYPPA